MLFYFPGDEIIQPSKLTNPYYKYKNTIRRHIKSDENLNQPKTNIITMNVLKQSTKRIESKSDKLIEDKGKPDEINLKMFKIFEYIGKIIILKSSGFCSFDKWKCLKFAVLLLTLGFGPKVSAGIIRDDDDVGPCLLGSFTQVQSWVQEDGSLSQKLSKIYLFFNDICSLMHFYCWVITRHRNQIRCNDKNTSSF